jgi:hypothetical protein
MLLQKLKIRRFKLSKDRIVLKKIKFEDLQTKIFVDVEGQGCLGHPQSYVVDHS